MICTENLAFELKSSDGKILAFMRFHLQTSEQF